MLLTFGLGSFIKNLAKDQTQFAFPVSPNANATPDLQDRRQSRFVDAHGNRITGLVSLEDATIGAAVSPISDALRALFPAAAILMGSIGGIPYLGPLMGIALILTWASSQAVSQAAQMDQQNGKGNFAITVVCLFMIAALFIPQLWFVVGAVMTIRVPLQFFRRRQEEKQLADTIEAAFSADTAADSVKILERAERERIEQSKRAIEDKSHFVPMATSTGMLAAWGDTFAPDASLVTGLSVNDMSTHLFAFGETGTGKTACCLRPIYKHWTKAKVGGALVLDGKGDLPTEFATSDPDFRLIEPGKTQFNPIFGLTPEDVTNVIVATMHTGKKDFWSSSAEELLRNAAVILEAAGQAAPDDKRFAWKLTGILGVIANPDLQTAVLQAAKDHPDAKRPGFLRAAVVYFEKEFAELAKDTKSGIMKTATTLLAPIVGHRDLYPWCDSSEGFEVESVCTGAKIGIATPSYKYGNPGLAIQALAKARVYRAIRMRGSKWQEVEGQKPVMLMMDECQMLVGEAEEIFAVARSLGLVGVCATQTIDGLEAAMGKEEARTMLGNFRSLISFTSSPRTLEYVSERLGFTVRRVEAELKGIDYIKLGRIADSGYGVMNAFQPGQGACGEYTLKVMETITKEELGAALSPRFHAAVLLNRASAPRRDVCVFQPGGIALAN